MTVSSPPRINRRISIVGAFALVCLAATGATAASLEATFARHSSGSRATVDHAIWDRQTKAYVKPDATGLNRVDYKRWKADGHKDLKAYVALCRRVDPANLDKPEQFAFWANLYNARTVDIVLDKYPVKSIKDISLGGGLKALVGGGPWQAKAVKVSGIDLSLDDIEHKVLRALFKDARVHYALNCASYGCPNLQAGAFTGAALDAQLDAGADGLHQSPARHRRRRRQGQSVEHLQLVRGRFRRQCRRRARSRPQICRPGIETETRTVSPQSPVTTISGP